MHSTKIQRNNLTSDSLNSVTLVTKLSKMEDTIPNYKSDCKCMHRWNAKMEHRKCIVASSREITINRLCEISTTIPKSYSASQKKKSLLITMRMFTDESHDHPPLYHINAIWHLLNLNCTENNKWTDNVFYIKNPESPQKNSIVGC